MDTPKKIYLCQDEDDVYESAISWCEDPAGDENVTYIRADVVAERLDALRAEIAEDLQAVKAPLAGRLDTARRDLLGSEAKEAASDDQR